jgi:hypothetical protein
VLILAPVPSPRAILVGGWAAFLVYAFPGYLGWDAMTQMTQARLDHYTDDHPPAMAILWRFCEHFVRGPLLMLLIVTILFVWGLYRLLQRYLPDRKAAIVTLVVLWFPPIGTIMAAIFKDTMMAAFLIAGIPLLTAPSRRSWLGLACIGAATLFRYNAIAATFPLVILLWRYRATVGWRRYAIAFVAWFGVTAVTLAAPKFLADEETHYWYWSNALQDIAGTIEFARDYSDAELEQVLDGTLHVHDHIQDRFRAIYAPVDFRHLERGEHRVLEKPVTPEQRTAIARAWKQLVFGNFGAYLHYRWDNFAALMRFDHAVYVNAYTRFLAFGHEETNFLGHDAGPSHVQARLIAVMVALSETPLFDPSVYLVLALLLVPFVLRDRIAGALLASGLVYQAAWFFVAPTADYRYSHWFVTMTVVATILVFVRRYRRQAPSARRQAPSARRQAMVK